MYSLYVPEILGRAKLISLAMLNIIKVRFDMQIALWLNSIYGYSRENLD